MIGTLFRPGVRIFTLGCALTLVVAVGHTLGITNDEAPNPQWGAAVDAMHAARVEAGPFAFSLYDVLAAVWIQVGALLVMLAGKNLLMLFVSPAPMRPRLVRAFSLFDAACCGALAVLSAYYRIPPPLLSFAVLAVVFFLAAVLAGRVPLSPPG